jgi:energy-coupling factor transporter ATP-binding protein EcfA2
MREVLADGTTVVFVSHDLATIEAICERGIWLHDGEIRVDAPIEPALASYRGAIEQDAEIHASSAADVGLDLVMIDGAGVGKAETRGRLRVELGFRARLTTSVRVDVGVTQGTAAPIFTTSRTVALRGEPTTFEIVFDSIPLPGGRYYLWAAVTDAGGRSLVQWQPLNYFDVDGPSLEPAPRGVLRLSPVHVVADWRGAGVADDAGSGGAQR